MIGVAEKELCLQFDMDVDGEKLLDRYLGRGKEARVVKRPAIPRGCLQQGRVSLTPLGLDRHIAPCVARKDQTPAGAAVVAHNAAVMAP